jgi:hypothetical protein
MGKRFSRLNYALKAIQNPAGTSSNEPPVDSIAGNFRDFRDGRSVINYPRDPSSLPGGLNVVWVSPFHTPFDAGSGATIGISDRVEALTLTTIAATRTAAGVITAAPTDIIDVKKFTPAKAIVRLGATGAGVNTVSQITGVSYSKKDDPSYTIPMGQKTGSTFESEVRADVLAAVNAIGDDASVSFDSEEVG